MKPLIAPRTLISTRRVTIVSPLPQETDRPRSVSCSRSSRMHVFHVFKRGKNPSPLSSVLCDRHHPLSRTHVRHCPAAPLAQAPARLLLAAHSPTTAFETLGDLPSTGYHAGGRRGSRFNKTCQPIGLVARRCYPSDHSPYVRAPANGILSGALYHSDFWGQKQKASPYRPARVIRGLAPTPMGITGKGFRPFRG